MYYKLFKIVESNDPDLKDAKNLTCDVSYTVNMDEEEKNTYCNISKLELLSFLEDINNFTDAKDIKSIVDKGISHK